MTLSPIRASLLRRESWALAVTTAVLGAWTLAGSGSAIGAEIEAGLRETLVAQGTGSYLVYLEAKADLTPARSISDRDQRGAYVYDALRETARLSQAGLVAYLEDPDGADDLEEFRTFFIANVVLVRSGVETFDAIARRPEVVRIDLDRPVTIPETMAEPPARPPIPLAVEYGIDLINADDVWVTLGNRGEGIIVASIDTGVLTTHEALNSRYRGTVDLSDDFNFYDPGATCGGTPCDNHGHGTHTMGIMAGEAFSNQIGVAPGARWIAAKGCATSSCSSFDLLSSAEWMVAPCPWGVPPGDPSCDPAKRPHVLSNSWGGGGGNNWYQSAVDAWDAAGIFHVFMAGNSGPGAGTITSPSDYCNTTSVGAVDSADTIAGFSSRGPGDFASCTDKPDLVAPGVSIRSSWVGSDSSYQTISGASQAAPHVAGCLALMRSMDPGLSYADAVQLLKDTAGGPGAGAYDSSYGWGRIDCFEAASNLTPRFRLLSSTESVAACHPSAAVFDIDVISVGGFTDPVTLTSLPPGSFTVNPVTPPGASSLSVPTTVLPEGVQTVTARGTSGDLDQSLDLELWVYDHAPATPTLLLPEFGAGGVSTQPTFSWFADGSSHLLEVATDPDFSNIVLSEVIVGADPNDQHFTSATPLQTANAYFWRVTSSNPCGAGSSSVTRIFYTGFAACSTPGAPIPDNEPGGVTDSIVVPNGGVITDLDISVTSTHTWVGDLRFELEHVASGTFVALIDRPGYTDTGFGCSGDDIDAVLDDAAGTLVEEECAAGVPAIAGSFIPNEPLAAFNGLTMAGEWRLVVSDHVGGDSGTLEEWCLLSAEAVSSCDGPNVNLTGLTVGEGETRTCYAGDITIENLMLEGTLIIHETGTATLSSPAQISTGAVLEIHQMAIP